MRGKERIPNALRDRESLVWAMCPKARLEFNGSLSDNVEWRGFWYSRCHMGSRLFFVQSSTWTSVKAKPRKFGISDNIEDCFEFVRLIPNSIYEQ